MTRLKPLQWIILLYCVLTESKSLICGVREGKLECHTSLHHSFLSNSLPSLHDYVLAPEKLNNFLLCGGVK